jgi:hypothetical protein
MVVQTSIDNENLALLGYYAAGRCVIPQKSEVVSYFAAEA